MEAFFKIAANNRDQQTFTRILQNFAESAYISLKDSSCQCLKIFQLNKGFQEQQYNRFTPNYLFLKKVVIY